MDNLTPTLNEAQLKGNIDALQKAGKDNNFVQSYVNNYQRTSDGRYTLKQAQPVQKHTSGGFLTSEYEASTPLGQDMSKREADIKKTASDTVHGKISPQEGILQGAGAVAGGVGDVVSEGAKTENNALGGLPMKIANAIIPHIIPGGTNIQQALQQPAVQKVLGDISKGYSAWAQANPRIAKDLESAVNVGAFALGGEEGAPAVKSAVEALPEAASGVADAVSGAASSITKKVAGETPTLEGVVGKITQATEPKDIKTATRALSTVDLSNAKTFDEAVQHFDTKIKENTTEVDTRFGSSDKTYKPEDLTQKTSFSDKPIRDPKTGKMMPTSLKTDHVTDALDQLHTYYEKTNNPAEQARIMKLEAKYKNEGLTPKEINDIAREHGKELNAFNLNGEAASGLKKQAAENTRTGVKETARDLMPDENTRAIDKNTTDLIKTRDMMKDMSIAVQKFQNKIEKAGLLKKAGAIAGKALKFVSGDFLGGLLKSITGDVAEFTKLNPLELQKKLPKLIEQFNKLNAMTPEEAIKAAEKLSSFKK